MVGPEYQQYNRLLDWDNRTEGLKKLKDWEIQDCRTADCAPTAWWPRKGAGGFSVFLGLFGGRPPHWAPQPPK